MIHKKRQKNQIKKDKIKNIAGGGGLRPYTEYEDFINHLKSLDSSTVIDRAYEIVSKENLRSIFSNMDFDNKDKINTLLKLPKILDVFYQEWLKVDVDEIEYMEYCVTKLVNDLTKYNKLVEKQNRER